MTHDLGQIAGSVIVGGFDGTTLPGEIAERLLVGHLAGVTLFKRNIENINQVAKLCEQIIDATQKRNPLISIDQEGGRVARLKEPVLRLPPMRRFGQENNPKFTRRVFEILGEDLAAIGINLNFAPVADVDSNPANPV